MFSPKFITKYMRLARLVGTDANPCYSRQIGAIIVDPSSNRILGTGYNGPPPGTPHTDTPEYLREYFWPMLTRDDKISLCYSLTGAVFYDPEQDEYIRDLFVTQYANKGICPRRLIDAKSGQRSEFCSCGHAERHAITNAAQSCLNTWMFCWCGVPCLQCCDSIIQAGIKGVHCLIAPVYHAMSPWLLEKGGVALVQHDPTNF